MTHAAEVLFTAWVEVMRDNLSYLVTILLSISLLSATAVFVWIQLQYRRMQKCLEMGWDVERMDLFPPLLIMQGSAGFMSLPSSIYPVYCLWVAFWQACYPYLVFHGLPLPFPFSLFS